MCALILCLIFFGITPALLGLGMMQADIFGIKIAGAVIAIIGILISWVSIKTIKGMWDSAERARSFHFPSKPSGGSSK